MIKLNSPQSHPLSIEFWLLRKRIIDLRKRKADDAEIDVLIDRQHAVWLENQYRLNQLGLERDRQAAHTKAGA